MNMKNILYIAIWVFSVSNIYAQQQPCMKAAVFLPSMPACKNGDYSLAFEDNFDGNSLDLTKWELQSWGQGALYNDPNSKTQEYNSLDNITISNETLKIIAKKETVLRKAVSWKPENEILEDGLPNLRTYNYTSSNIWTHRKFFYGKYEIRCRLPNGKGFWPAFWTFGGQRWNEIDIFEIYGDNINRFTCNVHHDYDGSGERETRENCPFAQNNVTDFSQWHIFTCIFDFDKITWQIDGNTVRVFHRFSTISGKPISCGENIAIGTYFHEQSYPVEDMHIIMNLAIQSGNDAPDANTVFPSIYEIDYVRFYIKTPCDGCLDHIVYENTDQLPTITRAKNHIQAGNDVTVKNGQNVSFKSPIIKLLPGFSVQAGATFKAVAEECNLMNYEDVPISFVGTNAVDGYQIIKCINSVYSIEATGVLFYSFQVYNNLGQLIHSTSGIPTSNHINLWNTINAADAFYSVHLELTNCSGEDVRDYNLLVLQGKCNKANSLNAPDSNQKTTNEKEIEKTVSTTLDKELLIYPNPANEKLNVFYSANNSNSTAFVIITDINGRELFREQKQNRTGTNKKTIDVSQFLNGTYILRIISNDEKLEGKFVILK